MRAPALLLPLLLQLPADPPRQIDWQRTLEDARIVAEREGRPLLLAVNMDGESAAERIVRERYKDPAFVALTRRFVPLVSSVFRHAPRDRDVRGRRLPCPRLGLVTCGEHVLLEPLLYDAFLGGERIAPRHALVFPSGEKLFDLFLLFDLEELDRALADAQQLAPPPLVEGRAASPARRALPELARERGRAAREALEALLAEASDGPDASPGREALALLAEHGDRGALDALAVLLLRERSLWRGGRRPLAEWEASARALGLVPEAVALVRDALARPAPEALAPALGAEAELLGTLGRLAGEEPAARTLLLSYLAFSSAGPEGDERAAALAGLAESLGWERVAPALRAARPCDLGERLAALARPAPAAAESPAPALAPETELEAELVRLDEELARAGEEPPLSRAAGFAALGLARRRAERGDASTLFLLEDAERWLARAFAADPHDLEVALARARVAFMASRFEDQEARAEEALAAAEARADEEGRIEALRWLGDGAARLAGARSGGELVHEAEGLARGGRALLDVVASPLSEPADWQAAASFFGALGRLREETALARLGLERFPDDAGLHQALTRGAHATGFPERAAELADELAAAQPRSAVAAWYAGLAHLLLADWMRRGEAAERALFEYRLAGAGFEQARELEPGFAESCEHYLGLAALGRGFAHLLADRRAQAAAALREGLGLRPALADQRDGLEREPLDLLDGALEWRASGPSPVDALALARELGALEAERGQGSGRWERAVADAELREALRSFGRGDERLGEEQLALAIEAARLALAHEDTDESRRALAQPLAIRAERALEARREEEARAPLAEALALLELEPPAGESDEALREAAARARAELGEARPLARPGR